MTQLIARRLELLQLEGMSIEKSVIVKQLSQKYQCSPKSIYRDFYTRWYWQPSIQGIEDQKRALMSTVNWLRQMRKRAVAKFYLAPKAKATVDNVEAEKIRTVTESVKLGYSNQIVDITLKIYLLLYPNHMRQDLFSEAEKKAILKDQINFNDLPAKVRRKLLAAEEALHMEKV